MMPRNVLISGSSILLGGHLAALRLVSTGDNVFYAVPREAGLSRQEVAADIRNAVRQIARGEDADAVIERVTSRLHLLDAGEDFAGAHAAGALTIEGAFEEVWFLAGASNPTGNNGPFADSAAVKKLLPALPQLGCAEFNYVGRACLQGTDDGPVAEASCRAEHASCEAAHACSCALEHEVIRQCGAHAVNYRIFRTSLIAGETSPKPYAAREDFQQFLTSLDELKNEVEERLPEYFEYQALRCCAPEGVGLNMIRVEHAAELLQRIARRPDTSDGYYNIVAPEHIPFTELCERIGMAYDLSILVVEDRTTLNAVDRLFDKRLNVLRAYFSPTHEFAGAETYRAADFTPGDARFDEDEQLELFQTVRRRLLAARTAYNERIASLHAALEQKTIDRDGFQLTYYAGGEGTTPIVLLNALGQGLHYWYRLMDILMRRHRVLIWEPRGVDSSPQPFLLRHQVDDLEAILRQEAVETCYPVGWCTGPKVALEFYRRRPEAVSSMVFLNSSFRCAGSDRSLDSLYERNMEILCRAVERRPSMAATALKSLQANMGGDDLDVTEETDAEQLATGVLSMMNVDLKPHVLAPFRSESTLINYSRQLLDFWTHDMKADAGAVSVPVLFVASEYDKIASTAMSRDAMQHFPGARYAEVQGATHYCLYDRPDLIAGLIENFLRDPDSLNSFNGEVSFAAHTCEAV